MLSHHNILLPSSGDPPYPHAGHGARMLLPDLYQDAGQEDGKVYGSFEEAKIAYEFGVVGLRDEINVRNKDTGEKIKTTVGRIIFNEVLPKDIEFVNKTIDKSALKQISTRCSKILSYKDTGKVLDSIKNIGFRYATKSGTTIAMNDIEVPSEKTKILAAAEDKVATIENQYHRGLITEDERYSGVVRIWNETTDTITSTIQKNLNRYGGVYMMATSGAKGNISQIRQMAGMRGLMTDPAGKIIEFPIKSSLREGHSILEYFISTHGARKGLADTALRTSDSGYLTRRPQRCNRTCIHRPGLRHSRRHRVLGQAFSGYSGTHPQAVAAARVMETGEVIVPGMGNRRTDGRKNHGVG